jgi:DNA-binding NarL/FixJ family response regulator
MSIKILLADDHHIIRQGIRALLEAQKDFEIIGEADDGRTAVKLACQHNPDVIIMDVSMPELNGIDATRQILREIDKTKVIALSMYSDKRFIKGMLEAGVSGYLLKNCVAAELISAIRSVMKGQKYLSPQILGEVVEGYLEHLSGNKAEPDSPLSSREREIVQLVAEGKDSRQIAECLHISPKTVESHKRRIMDKLEIHSVATLTKFAIRQGLTSIND